MNNLALVALLAVGAYLAIEYFAVGAAASSGSRSPAEELANSPLGSGPPTAFKAIGLIAPVATTIASTIGGGGAAAASGGSGAAGAAGGIGAGGAALVGGMAGAFVVQFVHVLTSPSPEETRAKLNSTSYGAFVLQFGDYTVRDSTLLLYDMSKPDSAARAMMYQRLLDSGVPKVANGSAPTPSWMNTQYSTVPAFNGVLVLSNYQYALDRGFNLFVNERDNGEAFLVAQRAVINQIGAGETIAPLPEERTIFRTKGAFGF